jgi:coenzyme F420-0:L-glutamate ligase/coenzyme F420-1:gamma-L-glutamate ligase
MITIFAPDGIGDVGPGTDLVSAVADAAAADDLGPLQPGDIVVITSKIISKAENRYADAADREAMITDESRSVVAQRGALRIVRTRTGLTIAAAGVDNSNVAAGRILLLPVDPDGSADRLATGLSRVAGDLVGVIVSDTAGRPWRLGQTDHAIGAAQVTVLEGYAGRIDAYGNELAVTTIALAAELAAAADLVKQKLAGRPVAIIRGLADLVGRQSADQGAAAIVRTGPDDLFSHGSREAVLAALCRALDTPESYGELVGLDAGAVAEALLSRATLPTDPAELVRHLLTAADRLGAPPEPVERDAPSDQA